MKILKMVLMVGCLIAAGTTASAGEAIKVESYNQDYNRKYHHRFPKVTDSQKGNIEKLNGVTGAFFSKHETHVFKSDVYVWEEIEPAILFILKEGGGEK